MNEQDVRDFVDRVVRDYESRPWRKLGSRAWAEHVAETYETSRPKLTKDRRKPVVERMYAAGMSFQNIGAVLGVVTGTAHNDFHGIRRRKEGGVHVYLIGSREFRPVKIGRGHPRERVATLQIGSPFLLEVFWQTPGDHRLEHALQDRFRDFRVRGEWFEFPEGSDPVQLVSEAAAEWAARDQTLGSKIFHSQN